MIVDTTPYSNEAAPSGNDRLQKLWDHVQSTTSTAPSDTQTRDAEELAKSWETDLREIMRKENGKPTVTENLVELRKIQYKTIEKLCAMLTSATGEDHSKALETFNTADLSALVTVTQIVSDQGAAIDSLVEECRKLIGI